jgi:hypothetical protein
VSWEIICKKQKCVHLIFNPLCTNLTFEANGYATHIKEIICKIQARVILCNDYVIEKVAQIEHKTLIQNRTSWG